MKWREIPGFQHEITTQGQKHIKFLWLDYSALADTSSHIRKPDQNRKVAWWSSHQNRESWMNQKFKDIRTLKPAASLSPEMVIPTSPGQYFNKSESHFLADPFSCFSGWPIPWSQYFFIIWVPLFKPLQVSSELLLAWEHSFSPLQFCKALFWPTMYLFQSLILQSLFLFSSS